MDDGAHHGNGRPRPPQGQFFLQHQPSMKHIMAIMHERDRAIQERNIALTDKKTALAERDLAILNRDQAIQDRNSAMMERENAIVTFQYRKNTMNSGVEHTYHMPRQHIHHRLLVKEPEPEHEPEYEPETEKPKKAKKAKEPKMTTPNKKIVKKKVRKEREDYELGLNEVAYDESMPVPVCSCTGVYRYCYKWGSGGWQSSCCTTTMSVYPLPQVPNKRHGRIGGRKMSGSAYNKLLRRLAVEGHDLSNPVDLKDNWARHGTNRYITIK